MNIFKQAVLAAMLSAAVPLGAVHAATPADVLVVAQNIDDIVAIDPAQAYEFSSGELVTNIYDRLVQYEPEDLETLAGGLASDWEVDEAAKTITFTLRDGVTFHSGNPLRPQDVLFSFRRVVALEKAPSFILTQLGWTADNIEEMVTLGDNSVTIRYAGDFSPNFVLNVIASRPASIVDELTAMENEVDGDFGNAWLNANSAGTGPFKLRVYRPAELATLDANPDYFKGAPKIGSVIVRHVAEAATQQLLLESGDVDLAKNLTPDQVGSLEGRDNVKIETYPQAAVHWFSFNQKTESLTNEAVWDAARYLVDYEGMASTFLKGQMQVHQAFWPAGFPGALTDTPFTYDVEKAKQILEEGGVELPINVTLDVINSTPFTDIAQSLQSTFAQAGINFDILPGTGAQVITKYRARTHEAMLLYWGPDFMDPHSNAKAFAYNANNSDDNYQSTTTWRNSWAVPDAMNQETLAALAEPDSDKRNEMYLDLQKQIQEKAPFVVMFQAVKQVGMAPNVDGFVNGATSDFVFYRLVEKN